jgi:hypothetical protein
MVLRATLTPGFFHQKSKDAGTRQTRMVSIHLFPISLCASVPHWPFPHAAVPFQLSIQRF